MTPLYHHYAQLMFQALEAPGGIVVRVREASDWSRAVNLFRTVRKKLRSEALAPLIFRKGASDPCEIFICKGDSASPAQRERALVRALTSVGDIDESGLLDDIGEGE